MDHEVALPCDWAKYKVMLQRTSISLLDNAPRDLELSPNAFIMSPNDDFMLKTESKTPISTLEYYKSQLNIYIN